jgi:uncharacterized protein
MTDRRLSIRCGQAELPAVLSLPAGPARAGVVPLHPSHDRSRSQFLFEHLAQLLPARGLAVLRYDRRPMSDGRDVPYQVQVDDLRCAWDVLAGEIGPVPIGLWGFSQGAWIALLAAAADPAVAFLALVGCSAVSPARQMRYGTAEQLRRQGFGANDLAELEQLRTAWEQHQRGDLSRAQAQAVVDRYRGRPWFPLSWVWEVLPDGLVWDDMDFDPAVPIGRLTCPVLAFYGDDEWVPVQESIEVWRRHFPDAAGLTVRELPGTTHFPTLGGGRDLPSVSPEYTAALTGWLDAILAAAPDAASG